MTKSILGGVMRSINASQFKEQCLAILDNLSRDGLVITKRGKPVAKLMPYGASCADLIGSMKGKIRVKGDILSTGLRWDAES